MTAPRYYDADASRLRSEVESLQRQVRQLENDIKDARREADRARDNVQLLILAIANGIIFGTIIFR